MVRRDKVYYASLFLRIGLAITLIYAGIGSITNPGAWEGFIPLFMKNIVNVSILLNGHAIFTIILGIWLLMNWKIFYPAVLSGLFMGGIVLLNLGAFDIVFRDVSIFFAALALACLTFDER